MNAFQNLVPFAPWTFIFQICNLLVLLLILLAFITGIWYYLLRPMQEISARRREQPCKEETE